jgi:hypothetical protein
MPKHTPGAEWMVCERGALSPRGVPPFADHRPYGTWDEASDRLRELDPDGYKKLYIWRRR